MNEPYCGFGAFGVKAAYRWYDGIGHIHNRFLSAMKKLGIVARKATPKTVAVKETTVNAAKTKQPLLNRRGVSFVCVSRS